MKDKLTITFKCPDCGGFKKTVDVTEQVDKLVQEVLLAVVDNISKQREVKG